MTMEPIELVSTRRDFLKSAASTALTAGFAGAVSSAETTPSVKSMGDDSRAGRKPNIILYIADQMRWDFIGAYGLNPSTATPNLDKVFARGVTFTHAVTNQPLCAPSRACMMTGRYATETGVWKNGPRLPHDLPTLAGVLRSNGYSTNLIGKWHLSDAGPGFVPPEERGGFLDLWEGANTLELTSHPYEGTIWDGNGHAIQWKDEYRVDFLTDLAVKFLKQPQEKPFLLNISQIEPHFQNDAKRFIAPNGYADRFRNPFVPQDLLNLPGNWQEQLPDYYGDIAKIDESVGRILQTLEEQNLLNNTIFMFVSDHGCHFETRNAEYKRSPHDSSTRIPFLIQGPGFDRALQLSEIVGNIDLTPTLLDAAGVTVPASMSGRSLMPLIRDTDARTQWNNKALIQISESMVGRAIRTKEWTYCVANPDLQGGKDPSSMQYQEYVLYNNFSDPAQLVNLAGRRPFQDVAGQLRKELVDLIVASGERAPTITPARLYP